MCMDSAEKAVGNLGTSDEMGLSIHTQSHL